ncbi:hypothetical protein CDAR_7751 [Caerostris darwini]|uniref:Uncharacterized protein n=1 Tax=Caerostris darwini TaxID=1538125 RepID=A0AAV4RBI9_9ARAC|nr:hypothetical protein CDAR_7751 [Caerostris darwini]
MSSKAFLLTAGSCLRSEGKCETRQLKRGILSTLPQETYIGLASSKYNDPFEDASSQQLRNNTIPSSRPPVTINEGKTTPYCTLSSGCYSLLDGPLLSHVYKWGGLP